MKRLSIFDSMFLAAESRESMMHVGGLMIFTPPRDASPRLLRDLSDELRGNPEVFAPWNLKLSMPSFLKSPVQSWIEDDDFDLEYHVRRSALPTPGDERELGILVSRLHSVQMDFHRPPWEVHFIEGLEGGRFALYSKVHHALVDGYTAMKILSQSLTEDPDERDTPMYFSKQTVRPPRAPTEAPTFSNLLAEQWSAAKEATRALGNLWRAARDGDRALVAPLQAPRTILNRRISRNRRFATQQFPLERLRAIAKASGGTLNDVCLALCGSSIRRLLLELDALPAEPLIAMLPVNVRPKGDPGGGNAVGAILATLATDVADEGERLLTIIESTRRAKEQLSGMSKSAILQYSAALMTPLTLQQVTATAGRVRPAFNVVISNVPGPERPLYFRGCRLDAAYPLSIPFHGYGLNITINGYAGTLNFGFIGCRDVLPRMQRLAVYAADALEDLDGSVQALNVSVQ